MTEADPNLHQLPELPVLVKKDVEAVLTQQPFNLESIVSYIVPIPMSNSEMEVVVAHFKHVAGAEDAFRNALRLFVNKNKNSRGKAVAWAKLLGDDDFTNELEVLSPQEVEEELNRFRRKGAKALEELGEQ